MEIALAFKMSVTDRSETYEARQRAQQVAAGLGFTKASIGSVAIIVTEAANNLAKYGAGGEIIVQTMGSQGLAGIEIIALDRGPGMANPCACMRDGFSTGGTPGTGLGAIIRLSTVFDVASFSQVGTALVSRYWPKIPPKFPQRTAWEIGALSVPKPGQTVCGDGYAWNDGENTLHVVVSDGLGHGPLAADASLDAIRAFHANVSLSAPADILKTIHDTLRSTRGAAVAVAAIDAAAGIVRFAGIGNISGIILGSGLSRNMVSQSGIVGSDVKRIQTFDYPWSEDATLILHSDGISSRLRLDPYPGLFKRHPSLVAGVIYRDYGRGTDDSTVVVVRQTAVQDAADRIKHDKPDRLL